MQGTINHQRLSLQAHFQVRLLDINGQLLRCGSLGNGNVHSNFVQSLHPMVLVGLTAISLVWKRTRGLIRLILLTLSFVLL